MKLHDIDIDLQRLGALCRAQGIRELALFGSITREDFRADSDIDAIVEFQPGAAASLWDFADVELSLSDFFGRSVHLHTPSMIHPYLRRQIAEAARKVYAA